MNKKFLILILVSGIGSIATVAYASNTTITNTSVSTTTVNTFNWQSDVQIDNDGTFDNVQQEPDVASSRSNPGVLVSGYIQQDAFGGPPRCKVSRSLDSGLTWQEGSYTGNPGNNAAGGDPSITSFLNGTFLYGCLGATFGRDANNYLVITGSAISFQKSSDDGLTWASATQDIIRQTNQPQLDKPWIAVDWGAFKGYNNRVYACWTEFDYAAHTTSIKFSQILPTYSNTVTIASAQWSDDTFRAKGPYVQGCQIVTGPGKAGIGNELFLIYEKVNNSTSGQILFNRNYHGGDPSSWLSTSKAIGTIQRFPQIQTPCTYSTDNRIIDGCLPDANGQYFRANHLPYLAVDKLGSPHVVWTTYNNNANLVYTPSYNCAVDQGQCDFAPQVTIDTSTKDQFEPAIVSDSSANPRGIIIVTANDKRDSPTNTTWKPWSYSCQPTSTSGPGSCQNTSDWTNLKINNDETITDENFIGEYHGVTSSKSNHAVSIYYYRSCTSCTKDIHSLGAK